MSKSTERNSNSHEGRGKVSFEGRLETKVNGFEDVLLLFELDVICLPDMFDRLQMGGPAPAAAAYILARG